MAMKKRDVINTLVVCGLFLLSCRCTFAAISVGDKPTLKFTASGGEKIDLAAL